MFFFFSFSFLKAGGVLKTTLKNAEDYVDVTLEECKSLETRL